VDTQCTLPHGLSWGFTAETAAAYERGVGVEQLPHAPHPHCTHPLHAPPQGLAWSYTAETAAILAAEVVVGLFAMRKVQTMSMAAAVLCVYPASLLLVATMEAYGWD
jgi:hypothetical protein